MPNVNFDIRVTEYGISVTNTGLIAGRNTKKFNVQIAKSVTIATDSLLSMSVLFLSKRKSVMAKIAATSTARTK
jgi:hypothetical protein